MVILMSGVAYADESVVSIPTSLDVHQGFVIPWDNASSGFMNMSTLKVMETNSYEPFGAWNALWDGWSLDAAWSYDAGTSKAGLMLGRHFGTLGKYLPISYPLADKVDITLYPIGIIVDDITGSPNVGGASGAGIIKFDVNF